MEKRGISKINKKSQAGIISTILLILIILVSIVIVWNVVYFLVNSNSSKISADMFTTQIDVPSTKLYITGGAQVKVHRGPGSGALSGLTFIFQKKSGETKTLTRTTNLPNELETKTYEFNSTEVPFNNTDIAKISVISVFGTNLGIQIDESVYPKDSSGNRVLEINSSSGLVSWWKFDGNMQDSVSVNHGSCTSCPTLTTDNHGNVNRAYSFNGVDSSIIIADNSNLDLSQATGGTVSVWIKTSSGASGPILIKLATGTYSNGYWLEKIGPVTRVGVYAIYPAILEYNGAKIINDNNWHQLTQVWTSTNLILYVDGIQDISTPYAFSFTTASNNLLIGGRASPADGYFNGLMDNVMIYNRPLSLAEVQASYNNQK